MIRIKCANRQERAGDTHLFGQRCQICLELRHILVHRFLVVGLHDLSLVAIDFLERLLCLFCLSGVNEFLKVAKQRAAQANESIFYKCLVYNLNITIKYLRRYTFWFHRPLLFHLDRFGFIYYGGGIGFGHLTLFRRSSVAFR